MAKNLSRQEEQRGTRNVMLVWLAISAAILIVGLVLVGLWPVL